MSTISGPQVLDLEASLRTEVLGPRILRHHINPMEINSHHHLQEVEEVQEQITKTIRHRHPLDDMTLHHRDLVDHLAVGMVDNSHLLHPHTATTTMVVAVRIIVHKHHHQEVTPMEEVEARIHPWDMVDLNTTVDQPSLHQVAALHQVAITWARTAKGNNTNSSRSNTLDTDPKATTFEQPTQLCVNSHSHRHPTTPTLTYTYTHQHHRYPCRNKKVESDRTSKLDLCLDYNW